MRLARVRADGFRAFARPTLAARTLKAFSICIELYFGLASICPPQVELVSVSGGLLWLEFAPTPREYSPAPHSLCTRTHARAHTQAHTHTRTHALTHTHTHTRACHSFPLSRRTQRTHSSSSSSSAAVAPPHGIRPCVTHTRRAAYIRRRLTHVFNVSFCTFVPLKRASKVRRPARYIHTQRTPRDAAAYAPPNASVFVLLY